jgi:hypothetical protein
MHASGLALSSLLHPGATASIGIPPSLASLRPVPREAEMTPRRDAVNGRRFGSGVRLKQKR